MTRSPGRPALLAAIALAGCGSYQSSYQRGRAAPTELVWRYHDRFQVTQDGKIIAEQRDWNTLVGVVSCVPRARAWADDAASGDRTGAVLTWTGVATWVGSLVAGGIVLFSDTDNTDQVLLGAGIMIGGTITGGTLVATGVVKRARADATAIDAVNVYNDERASCAR